MDQPSPLVGREAVRPPTDDCPIRLRKNRCFMRAIRLRVASWPVYNSTVRFTIKPLITMNPLSKLLLLFIAIVAAPAALAGPYDEAVLADEPVAYWRFEEPEGATTAVDSGSSKTDGTYVEIGLAKPSASDVLGTAAEWGNDGDGSAHIDFGEPNAGALGQLVNLRDEFVDDKKTSVEFWMNTSQEGNVDSNC